MSDTLDSGLWVNYVLSLLLKRVIVPTDFHSQCDAVNEILKDDLSGLVDVLTDFNVESASVNFSIESKNAEYTRIINKWLGTINMDYRGKIPVGINAVAKEYYKERWKGSSFPVLKLGGWQKFDGGIELPTTMYFLDGSTINAKAKENEKGLRRIFNYDYYLEGSEEYKLEGEKFIFARPYGRWFDEYPVPYLIKRGVYHNWRIIKSLKTKQSEVVEQIIPYLMLIKKGSPELVRENIKVGYNDEELLEVKNRIQTLIDKISSLDINDKTIRTPMRAVNFDEEIKHIIPDIKSIFDKELFAVAERNILSALGFVDVVEATSTSRRESILNPKAFIEETKSGVKGFKEILQQVMYQVEQKNTKHSKYMNVDYYITHSPVTAFSTDDFKEKIRQLYDRGRISSQTAVELVAEVDFETEVIRREREAERGVEETMYPQITQNKEGEAKDFTTEKIEKNPDKDEENIPDDKKDPVEKENYNASEVENLETAPYKNIRELPARVKKNLSPGLQSVFLRVFNRAFETYGNESKAFRIAWGVIKKIAKKNKSGKWIKKAKLTKAIVEEVLTQEDEDAIEKAIKEKQVEILNKKDQLLTLLLDNKKKENKKE